SYIEGQLRAVHSAVDDGVDRLQQGSAVRVPPREGRRAKRLLQQPQTRRRSQLYPFEQRRLEDQTRRRFQEHQPSCATLLYLRPCHPRTVRGQRLEAGFAQY